MVALSGQRERLVGYIRQIAVLNDEEKSFSTFQQFWVEIPLVIPLNIIYTYFPNVLSKFIPADLSTSVRLSSMKICVLEEWVAAGVHNITVKTKLPQAGTGNLLQLNRLTGSRREIKKSGFGFP